MEESIMLNRRGETEEQFLAAYDLSRFERPSVTVDALVFTVTEEEQKSSRRLPEKALRLLMVKRADHPFLGKWALPGGFVEMRESLEEAALRELKEETSVENIDIEQLYTWGDVHRDPRTRVIGVSYLALADSAKLKIRANDDAADAAWFTVSCKQEQENKSLGKTEYTRERLFRLTLSNAEYSLSALIKTVRIVEGGVAKVKREIVESEGIAFDHAKIIGYGLERLREKIENTDSAFSLMPALFTLTELQQVYEAVLDKKLLKANFRRKVAAMVIKTGESAAGTGRRPATLFRFNPDWEAGGGKGK